MRDACCDIHQEKVGIGKDTPIHKMIKQSAKILLLGVDHISNSAIHLAQNLANVPYLERYRTVNVLNNKGIITEFRIRRAGCSKGFNKIIPILNKKNIENYTEIGMVTDQAKGQRLKEGIFDASS